MQNFHARNQPLDSRQLLAFVTLARTHSFTLAGKEINLSQSAISHALKVLEADLSCRLVDRLGKKVHLTPAGDSFLHHAKKILADMTAARNSIEQLAKWGKGRLRVAASESIHQWVLPQVLHGLQKDFPDWPITVVPADSLQSVELLRQQSVTLAITLAPSQAEAVDVVPLFTDELSWVVAPEHPWAQRATVAPEEVSAQKLILGRASSQTFRLLENYFHRDGIALKPFWEVGGLEAVKKTVRHGLGIAALSPWVVRQELEEKTLVALPLGRRKLRRNWCALRASDHKSNLAEETFIKLCQTAGAALSS